MTQRIITASAVCVALVLGSFGIFQTIRAQHQAATIAELKEQVSEGFDQDIRNELGYLQSMMRAQMDMIQEHTAIASMIIRQQQKIIDQLKEDVEAMPANGGI